MPVHDLAGKTVVPGMIDTHHRIEHFEVYDENLARRVRALGVHLAIQPPFNHYFGGHTRAVPETRFFSP
jgi:predicted amidohydrolase YtcJ